MFGRNNFLKIIEKSEKQLDRVGVGIGALVADISANLLQSLEIDLGYFVPLPGSLEGG